MTKYPPSVLSALPEGNDYDLEDDEAEIATLRKGSLPFPGEQYFNGIMLEKMRPKKVAKFKTSRKLANDF